MNIKKRAALFVARLLPKCSDTRGRLLAYVYVGKKRRPTRADRKWARRAIKKIEKMDDL